MSKYTYYLSFESLEPRALLGGFTPAELREAYGFKQAFRKYGDAAKGKGVAIAVVIAMDAPRAVHDLEVYSRRYHLPKPDITVTNLGGTGNGGAWYGFTTEAAIDVEMVHALLPLAKIHLVEAKGVWVGELAAAMKYAAAIPGVVAVSNSWGLPDKPLNLAYPPAWFGYGSFFSNNHVVYAAAAGDESGPLWYPANDSHVVAVGGTVMRHRPGRHLVDGQHRNDGSCFTQRPWLNYTSGPSNPAKTGPDVSMIGGLPGVSIFGPVGFLRSIWGHAIGTSVACPAFCAVIGAVDGIRLSHGDSPLSTMQVLAGMTPNEVPWVPDFIARFA